MDKGTTQETTLRQRYPDARVIAYDDSPLALQALRTGAIQAFAQDGAKLGALLATLPNRDQFEISPFTLTREYMGVGLPKGEERLQAAIDQILLELEKSGTAARIYDKYFGPKSQAPLARDFTIGSTVK
ncbi:Cystine-binding periplasmic protein precursor [compost metagenome]